MKLTITKTADGLNEVNTIEPNEFVLKLKTIFATKIGTYPCFIAPCDYTNNPHEDTKHTWHVRPIDGLSIANEFPAYTGSSLKNCIIKLRNAGNPVYVFSRPSEFLAWALNATEI